jgi:hypothetical protein
LKLWVAFKKKPQSIETRIGGHTTLEIKNEINHRIVAYYKKKWNYTINDKMIFEGEHSSFAM